MTPRFKTYCCVLVATALLTMSTVAQAHRLRLKGEQVAVAGSSMLVTPGRDWNSLSVKIGKNTETWTLDGEQLNDVTFFVGIPANSPLVNEKNKKKAPLPKFTSTTLPVELPELLERTYRAFKDSASFQVLSAEPEIFLENQGVFFSYEYTDADELTRKGEAHASIIGGKLYMITFEAPRLSYFDKTIKDFRILVKTARLRQ